MGTVEARSKDPSGCSSPSPENDKNELREALCALKNGASENGVGFSGHGNQGFGDAGGVEVKSRVSETNVSDEIDFVGREMEDGCQGLADSEMNGVSSLLKMRGSGKNLMFSYGGDTDSAGKLNSEGGSSLEVGMEGGERDWKKIEGEDDQNGKTMTVDVPIADTSENQDLEMEDLGDEGCGGFSVGDFVWGKIKSHPWWPGRIYDLSDASDFALKLRQKNRLLVAYFGDGTFAWCHPSQLKPFMENFEDMVKQSSSRAFVNAVQEAVNEVGRLLDLMSSSCVENKNRSEFTRPLADNSGVKEGILIPENGIEKLSAVLINPAELLSRVKQISEIISIANILELEILKARLSAFYLSRGGYRLPKYEAPQPIPGLEDSLRDKTGNVSSREGAVEAPVHGPFEEDYSTIPVSPKSGELSLSHGISGNRLNHRIKQKSIAEIMGEDKDVNTKTEGNAAEKMTVRKKRKGSEDTKASKPVQKRKGLFPNTDRNVASAENDGDSWGKENSDYGTLAQLKKKKALGIGNSRSGSIRETDQEGKAKRKNEKGSLSRERKKSKYLSPPFTIPTREPRKGEIETESPKISGKDQVSETVMGASDQLLKSPVPLKLNGGAFQENFSKELAIEQDRPGSSNYRTLEYDENETIDTTKIQVPSGEILSEVRYAAINPQIPTYINSLERIVDFIFIYRSSLYRQGSYYKIYMKHKPSKKRKKPESDLGMLRKDQKIQSDHISANNDSEPKKRRRKNETTSGLPKEKQFAVAKTGKKGTDKNASGASLFVTFGPGSHVPSKSDLIAHYSKFGALKESETVMFSSDYTARVFFLEASDAEKALSHSQNMNPFGSSEASFRLQYLSSGSKSEKSKSKASSMKKKDKTPAKTSASLSPGSEASKLNYIKQKLQGLTLMLEASDAKSPVIKTKLESEMKGLLEDVNKMVESSS